MLWALWPIRSMSQELKSAVNSAKATTDDMQTSRGAWLPDISRNRQLALSVLILEPDYQLLKRQVSVLSALCVAEGRAGAGPHECLYRGN